jgi:hypothetical protein
MNEVPSTFEIRNRCAVVAESPKYPDDIRDKATDFWDWFEAAFNHSSISLDKVAEQEQKALEFLNNIKENK